MHKVYCGNKHTLLYEFTGRLRLELSRYPRHNLRGSTVSPLHVTLPIVSDQRHVRKGQESSSKLGRPYTTSGPVPPVLHGKEAGGEEAGWEILAWMRCKAHPQHILSHTSYPRRKMKSRFYIQCRCLSVYLMNRMVGMGTRQGKSLTDTTVAVTCRNLLGWNLGHSPWEYHHYWKAFRTSNSTLPFETFFTLILLRSSTITSAPASWSCSNV